MSVRHFMPSSSVADCCLLSFKELQTLDSVKNALVGGAAAPRAMIQEFEEKHDVFLMHGWGMTEMSPLGTATSRTDAMDDMDIEDRYDLQQKQGKAFFGLEMIPGLSGTSLTKMSNFQKSSKC